MDHTGDVGFVCIAPVRHVAYGAPHMEREHYRDLEPAALWRHFAALNSIPRPSGHEQAAREYIQDVAEQAGADYAVDDCGNIVVRAGARTSKDTATIAIQSHLDMVCESEPGSEYDCLRDPVSPRVEGDVVSAAGTTLGADNGIGVAASLALLTGPVDVHAPLELLFTVQEETGLKGALGLDVSLLSASMLLNLDSEDNRALTVGCAGSTEMRIVLAVNRERPLYDRRALELRISGLRGGHSGMQIGESHGNAIRLAVELLERLGKAGVEHSLESIGGGSGPTTIPRRAEIRLLVAEDAEPLVAETAAGLREAWKQTEPDIAIELAHRSAGEAPIVNADAVIGVLSQLPHGVLSMSGHFQDTVETSANLALLCTHEDRVEIAVSIRSLEPEQLRALEADVRKAAQATGADVEVTGSYPGWPPREDSRLLTTAVDAYKRVHGHEPRIDVVHAGLECGAIVAKKPDLDAVSFGPLIKGAHTPGERVYASTVLDTWRLLLALLDDLAVARR
jgi:dipeptidase D